MPHGSLKLTRFGKNVNVHVDLPKDTGSVNTRREFLGNAASLAGLASVPITVASAVQKARDASSAQSVPTVRVSLDGSWQFRFDPGHAGETENWESALPDSAGWNEVTVPHTWQIALDSADYFGIAWYRRTFDVPSEWNDHAVRIEFEAVFHSARVWINGAAAGQHLRKGYTTFAFDITPLLHFGAKNLVAVQVDNLFSDQMLPRGRSSDWATDGGLYRPVNLLITPKVYIEHANVDALPDITNKTAAVDIAVVVRNSGAGEFQGYLSWEAVNKRTGLRVAEGQGERIVTGAGQVTTVRWPKGQIANATLWHFDDPALYTLGIDLHGPGSNHRYTTDFGIRGIEVKAGSFYLNGERVRLMGVERMAGSNPEFGMAEPASWIEHDHRDLKELNCVFTRVHWPQDRRVLDYCDQHGILIQSEVPSWGPDTFKGMGDQPAPEILENGLEQLREMIARDRNHPCIFSWGLCNEINGQNPPAHQFAQRMYEEAKKVDPQRLCSYASNSLQKTPGTDVAKLMDFIEWNEYYESWYGGTPDDVRRNLEEIHRAFPDKPIVISEYGYCACTPERPEGDARRIEILRTHTGVCREKEYVGGLIFFCYNDYRTHIGDKGTGVMKQRIHGVVDLLG